MLFTKPQDCLPPARMLSRDHSCRQLSFTASGHFSVPLEWYQLKPGSYKAISLVNSAINDKNEFWPWGWEWGNLWQWGGQSLTIFKKCVFIVQSLTFLVSNIYVNSISCSFSSCIISKIEWKTCTFPQCQRLTPPHVKDCQVLNLIPW